MQVHDPDAFIEYFLSHMRDPQPYDPVKAHEYYLRTRQLKGRQHQLHVAHLRHLHAVRGRLIRAKKAAMRIKDPKRRAQVLTRIAAAETQIQKVLGNNTPLKKSTAPGAR